MFKNTNCILLLLVLFIFSCKSYKNTSSFDQYPFEKENLIPWSIVGFDVKERTPKERIEMLQRLGFNQICLWKSTQTHSNHATGMGIGKRKQHKDRCGLAYM